MAKSRRRKVEMDTRPAVETIGMAETIRQIGEDMLNEMKVEDILAKLPRAKREELKRRLQEQESR